MSAKAIPVKNDDAIWMKLLALMVRREGGTLTFTAAEIKAAEKEIQDTVLVLTAPTKSSIVVKLEPASVDELKAAIDAVVRARGR